MNEEQPTIAIKQEPTTVKTYLFHIWYIIVIVILAILLLTYRNSLIKANNQVKAAQSIQEVQKKNKEADDRLIEVAKREKELYPILNKRLDELEKERIRLNAAKMKLDKATSDYKKQINKMTIDQVSAELTKLGYPNKKEN